MAQYDVIFWVKTGSNLLGLKFWYSHRSWSCDHFYLFPTIESRDWGRRSSKIWKFRVFENFGDFFMLPPSVALYLFYTHTSTVLRRSRDITWPTFDKKWPQFYTVFGLARQRSKKIQEKQFSKIFVKNLSINFRLERKTWGGQKMTAGYQQFKSSLIFWPLAQKISLRVKSWIFDRFLKQKNKCSLLENTWRWDTNMRKIHSESSKHFLYGEA